MSSGQAGTFLQLKTRREPPGRLTVDEKRIWNKLVDDKPGEWFCEDNLVLLEQYCKVVMRLNGFIDLLTAATDRVAAGMFSADEERKAALNEMKLFNNCVSQTSKDLNMIARNLRFTPHSRYDPKTTFQGVKEGTKEAESTPWDVNVALGIAGQKSGLKKMDWNKVQ